MGPITVIIDRETLGKTEEETVHRERTGINRWSTEAKIGN